MKYQWLSKEQQKVLLIVCFGYISPVLLVSFGFVPFSWRFYILLLAAIVVLIIARCYQFSLEELGLTQQRLGKSLNTIVPLTVVCGVCMGAYYLTQGARLDNSAYSWMFYLFFVSISAPVQELLYRGFLFGIFSRAKLPLWLQVLLSASLYSFVHLIYQDGLTLFLTFIMGLLWGYHYATYRNLHSIILSHALLGAIAVWIGLV